MNFISVCVYPPKHTHVYALYKGMTTAYNNISSSLKNTFKIERARTTGPQSWLASTRNLGFIQLSGLGLRQAVDTPPRDRSHRKPAASPDWQILLGRGRVYLQQTPPPAARGGWMFTITSSHLQRSQSTACSFEQKHGWSLRIRVCTSFPK